MLTLFVVGVVLVLFGIVTAVIAVLGGLISLISSMIGAISIALFVAFCAYLMLKVVRHILNETNRKQ